MDGVAEKVTSQTLTEPGQEMDLLAVEDAIEGPAIERTPEDVARFDADMTRLSGSQFDRYRKQAIAEYERENWFRSDASNARHLLSLYATLSATMQCDRDRALEASRARG